MESKPQHSGEGKKFYKINLNKKLTVRLIYMYLWVAAAKGKNVFAKIIVSYRK